MDELVVPEWTLGWRLRRSLAQAGMATEQMADEIGVSRTTVSSWLNDRGAQPRIGEIRQAAIAAGIAADDVDKLLGPGLALPSFDQRLTLRLVVDDGDTFVDPDDLDKPKRLGILGCVEPYCDGSAGHVGQHYQWVPE